MSMRRINVALGERSYPVVVGFGAITEINSLIPKSAKRAVVVTQKEVDFVPKL